MSDQKFDFAGTGDRSSKNVHIYKHVVWREEICHLAYITAADLISAFRPGAQKIYSGEKPQKV